MRRDYYAVLGIAATAGPREVRQAYQRLARQYSPDVNFWDETGRARSSTRSPRRTASSAIPTPARSTIGSAPGPGNDALAAGRRGDDLHIRSSSAFADAAPGPSLRQITAMRFSSCADCGATGRAAGRAVRGLPRPRAYARGRRRWRSGSPPASTRAARCACPARARRALRRTARRSRGEHARAASIRSSRARATACTARCRSVCGRRSAALASANPDARRRDGAGRSAGHGPGQVFRLRGQGLPAADRRGHAGRPLRHRARGRSRRGLDARADGLVRELERLVPLAPAGETSRDYAEAASDRSRQAALHDRRGGRDAEGAPADAALLREEGAPAAEPHRGPHAHVLRGGRRRRGAAAPSDARPRRESGRRRDHPKDETTDGRHAEADRGPAGLRARDRRRRAGDAAPQSRANAGARGRPASSQSVDLF